MEALGYIAALFMGLSLGLIGGGGSILTVPLLVYLFGVEPGRAMTDSLFVVGLTALAGGLSALRRQEVDLKTALLFAVPGFVGVQATKAWLLPALPDPVLAIDGWVVSKSMLRMLVFAALMVAASVSMIRSRPQSGDGQHGTKKLALIVWNGLFVGVVTGFVGAGGGFLIVPALVLLIGLPMKTAVGTSLLIIAANSLIGFVGDVWRGSAVDGPVLGAVAAIAIAGLFMGRGLARRASERSLKTGFGWFVLLMGAFILLDQLRRI